MTDWLTSLLSSWLINWQTARRTDWLTDSLSDWQTDPLTDWMTDWLTYWPINRPLTDWPNARVTNLLNKLKAGLLIVCVCVWQTECSNPCFFDCISVCPCKLTDWLTDWLILPTDRLIEIPAGWKTQPPSYSTTACALQWNVVPCLTSCPVCIPPAGTSRRYNMQRKISCQQHSPQRSQIRWERESIFKLWKTHDTNLYVADKLA